MKLELFAALALLSPLAACSDRGEAAMPRGARAGKLDSSAGTVVLGLRAGRPYRAVGIGTAGAIEGTVALHSALGDSAVAATRGSGDCGDRTSVTGARSSGASWPHALVWVDGVTSGKPLPDVRRETLVIEGCRFEPRLVAVVSRSTINVLSRDPIEHSVRFYRDGRGEPVEHIHTVDAGQVVPSEEIASASGIVEARCARHPWERAHIAVFDHPYFAITDDHGAFKLDGLTPGTYTVKAWHERLTTPVEQRVLVQPSGFARLDLTIALGP